MEAVDPFAGLFQSESEAKPQDKAPVTETATPAWHKQSPASSAASPVSTAQPLSTSKSLNNGIESSPGASFVPMGDSKAKKTKEAEASARSVESVLERFTQHIQGVVDSINRRLENIESRTEQLSEAVADGQQVDKLREEALKERLTGIDKSVREVSRGVQVIRDKQALLEAHAELAKASSQYKQAGDNEVVLDIKPPGPGASSTPQQGTSAAASSATAPPVTADQASRETGISPTASQQLPQQPPAQQPQVSQQLAPQPQQQPQQQQQPTVPTLPPSPHAPSAPHAPPASHPQEYQYSGAPGQQQQQQQPSAPTPFYGMPGAAPHFSAPPPSQEAGRQSSMPIPVPPPTTPGAYPAFGGDPSQARPAHLYSSQQQAQAGPSSHPPPPPNPPPPPPPGPQHSGGYQMPAGPSPAAPLPGQYSWQQPGAGPNYPSLAPPSTPPPPPPTQPSYGMQPPYSMPQQGTARGYPPPPPSAASYPPAPTAYPQRSGSASSYGPPARPGSAASAEAANRGPQSLPLEKVIDDVANMGFSRHEVRGVINQLMDNGQAVDLNIVLDRLMRAHRG